MGNNLKDQKKPQVAAIIVTYNRKELMKECLEAVLYQTFLPEYIFIIDNASTDGTYRYLKENGCLENPMIKYIYLKENCGGAGGFYEGIKRAGERNPDWYWLMDDDTIPYPDSLEQLILARDKINDDVGFLNSCVEGLNKEPMNIPEIDTTLTENGYSNWQKYLEHRIVGIKSATFVSLLVSKDAVRRCGLPCNDYFIWGDDTEYTTRITKYYAKGFLVGNSKVCHKRVGAKNLSIFNESDPDRINIYYYAYRNGTVNILFYEKKVKIIKEFLYRVYTMGFCIKNPFRMKKIGIILKGSFKGIVSYPYFKKYILSQLQGGLRR